MVDPVWPLLKMAFEHVTRSFQFFRSYSFLYVDYCTGGLTAHQLCGDVYGGAEARRGGSYVDSIITSVHSMVNPMLLICIMT